jgi:hypothetical protein
MKIDNAVELVNNKIPIEKNSRKDYLGMIGYGIITIGILYILAYVYLSFGDTIEYVLVTVFSVIFDISKFLYTYNQLGKGILFIILGFVMIKLWKISS